MKVLIDYLLTVIIMLGLDGIWLGVVAKEFNKKHLGYLMRDKFLWLPALVFYLIYAAGLVYFVIAPGTESRNMVKVVLSGVFLGIIAYSTFELTSMAAFKGWSFKLVLVDILWGAVMSGLTVFLVYKIRW
jgi:uncharacterized membrane protein